MIIQVTDFSLPKPKLYSWLIVCNLFQALSDSNSIIFVTLITQHISQKSHSEVTMTLAPINTSKESWTASCRLAVVHRRQAIHSKTQRTG